MGRKPRIGPEAAVIGGGNSAIDAARTALRIGAKKVTVLYRRTEKEMPASEEEIEEARAEGVGFEFLVAPAEAKRKKGRIELKLQKMRLGDIDQSGRPKPVPVEGSEVAAQYDQVIAAIGQRPGTSRKMGLGLDKGGRISVDPDTLAADAAGLFAGGDAVLGPASVIEAIAMGRKAAVAIDLYLGGKGEIGEKLAPENAGREKMARPEEEGERRRPKMKFAPAGKRVKSFARTELGYTRNQAREEASRCLQCDLEEP
jgi:NADPH-dependent glutamate synthase beta subunit-like oxidoreductase